MIRPRVMSHAVVHELIRIAGALGAKLPDGPIGAMLGVEEGYEMVERIAVGALRVGL